MPKFYRSPLRQLTRSPSVVVELETGCLWARSGVRFVVRPGGAAGVRLRDSGAQAEADLLFFHVDLDDLEVVLQALFELGVTVDGVAGLGDVAETLDAFGDFDECAELRGAQNLAVDHIANAMRSEEALPDIGLQLLDAQREAAVLRLDAENDSLDLFALLDDFRGMLDALGPAQVGDVDEAVNAVFDFDECAEVGEVADAALDDRADRDTCR